MIGLTLTLLSVCPQGADLERPEQQQAACMLAERDVAVATDRATLQRLLDEPEFSRARNRNASFFTVLWEQFFAWLKRVFQTREAAAFAKAVPFGVLTLAFAIALLAVSRFARFRRAPPPARPASATAEPLALRPAPEHLADARRLLGTAPREAIREALLALLSSLERRNLARPDRVKTNRELCAELPARGAAPELVRAVKARVDWYDRAFYSLGPIAADDARAFVDGIATLVTS